jgi:putative peptide zinc metalloprotease protein
VLAGWGKSDPRPTREKPQLAVVLVPRGAGTDAGAPTSEPSGAAAGWVFPFDKPLAPGAGDNQALAVNTTDNTIRYDVAFALVWIDDDSPALNTNEAYAFSSCENCAAVAVGFQVVLVTGDNHVAVPQNLSGAVNVDCVNCLSYALASQLFVTLDGPLSDAAKQQIAAVWAQIAQFGAHITEVPLAEISDRLTAFKEQILQIIESEQGPLTPRDSTAVEGGTSPTPGTTPTPGATEPDASNSSGPASPGSGPTASQSEADPTPSTPGTTTSGSTDSGDTVEPPPTPDDSTATPAAAADPTAP